MLLKFIKFIKFIKLPKIILHFLWNNFQTESSKDVPSETC